MAKPKKKEVFVFEIATVEPDPNLDDDEERYFFVPEKLDRIHQILSSLRDGSEDCAIQGGAWYFLHGGEAIPIDTIPELSARESEIIQAIKDSEDEGEIYLKFACVDASGDDHWSSGFKELSELPGFCGLLSVYGPHPEFGPNVMQKYSDGEFDTGIESERDPDVYTLIPAWVDKMVGDKHLLEFMDASFYG